MVLFSSLNCIWDAYSRKKRQLRQKSNPKFGTYIGNYVEKSAFLTKILGFNYK
jgi:hypothetical protein